MPPPVCAEQPIGYCVPLELLVTICTPPTPITYGDEAGKVGSV